MPPLTVVKVGTYEALQRIAQHSDFKGSAVNWCIAIAANSARSSVTVSPEGLATVSIRKLLRERASLAIPDEILREKLPIAVGAKPELWDDVILTRLRQVGDLFQDDRKRWHGTPVRLVRLGDNAPFVAVVGGLPTSDAEEYLGCCISEFGHLRVLSYEDLPKLPANSKALWQSYDNWLRLDARDIVQWTTSAIHAAIATAQRGAPFGVEDYEVLALRNERFFWRPVSALRTAPARPHLCRSALPGSQTKKEYWVALFASTKTVSVEKSAVVAKNDGIRLALGIPRCYGAARSVKCSTTDQACSVSIKDLLPYPERHLFDIALRDDARAYIWPAAFSPITEAVLSSLGFELTNS